MNYNQFSRPVRCAVIVGGLDSGNKLGVDETISELAEEFNARGFRIASVPNAIAGQLERVLAEVQKLCNNPKRLPKIVFYYCGHHGEQGFQLVDGLYRREDLFDILQKINGDKLGIFDCCYAGTMNRYASGDLQILAAAGENSKAYAHLSRTGKQRLQLSEAILEFMRERPSSFPLGTLFDKINTLVDQDLQKTEIRGDKTYQFPGKK